MTETVIAIEGNRSRPSHRGGGYRENIMFALNTTEVHGVAYEETDCGYLHLTPEETEVAESPAR